MQIMGESSEEGVEKGLGWIRGKVKKLPKKICHRLPHMGWNNVIKLKDAEILKNVHQETKFYFLHSYYFETEAIEEVLAKTSYNFEFNSIINDQNIYGIQFHPEKSHSGGYSILKNFSEI
jgi:glutamine amidotransferase